MPQPPNYRNVPWKAASQIAVLGSQKKPVDQKLANELCETISSSANLGLVDLEGSADLTSMVADFAVVLGGDGTILRVAQRMGTNQIPVLAVNLGKLGFLAAVPPDQISEVLSPLIKGQGQLIDHLMLECNIFRDDQRVCSAIGLNEAAVLAGPPYRILEAELHVDGELATTYRCDGLIISTPVGSTAHSLSAGGPILRKDLDAFVIQPISPHTLTVRPVVDSADRQYELVVREPNPTTAVVVDGREIHRLQAGDRVVVHRAASRFQLIEVRGQGYYRTLHEKLGWGGEIGGRACD